LASASRDAWSADAAAQQQAATGATRRVWLKAGASAVAWTPLIGAAGVLGTLPAPAQAAGVSGELVRRLREGGVVIALRHALAPGTFDPPGFVLSDCRTQRNLSDDGRAQARRIGAWFAEQGLRPRRVRSSPWCRCLETARLAFGQAETWPALGSPHGQVESTNAASLSALQQALAQAERSAGFEVWVTHMFVLSALTGENSSSGEGLLLARAPAPAVPPSPSAPQWRVAGRLMVP
jgi:phosphohistidine phosphatase SixA